MSFQKNKCDCYCVGGRHRSAIKNIYGDITSEDNKVIIGYCSIFNRKKSMTDNTIHAEGLGSFFKKFGSVSAKTVKKN